jgi:hypothetical protein
MIRLRKQVANLKTLKDNAEKEKEAWESKYNEMQVDLDRLKEQVIGQKVLQETKKIIWDDVIQKADDLRPYLNFIVDKETVVNLAKKAVALANEKLNKKPSDYAENAVEFLSGLSEEQADTTGIKDRVSTIIWAKRIINKHQQVKITQFGIDILSNQLRLFKEAFDPLFKKGLPIFWEENGTMLSNEEYKFKLWDCRVNQEDFARMDQPLTGQIVAEKLTRDFELASMFRGARTLHVGYSYREHTELRVLITELATLDLPSTDQCKSIEKYGKARIKTGA